MNDWTAYDGDIDAALTDAQAEVERITGRKFEQGTYTDEWVTSIGNYVYPKATPLVSVSDPANGVIDGHAIDLGYFNSSFTTEPYLSDTDRVQVTYVGGYSSADMPVAIKRIVARIAYLMVHPVEVANVPSGTTRMRVGDVELEGRRLGAAEVVDDVIKSELRPWIKREF